mmetsp:Transcript_118610/g.369497  ORF Transcript_118610/g.369497 Transcript_118610/m.369497 type:complete len:205 (-) Transcript_118610:221-835(-)
MSVVRALAVEVGLVPLAWAVADDLQVLHKAHWDTADGGSALGNAVRRRRAAWQQCAGGAAPILALGTLCGRGAEVGIMRRVQQPLRVLLGHKVLDEPDVGIAARQPEQPDLVALLVPPGLGDLRSASASASHGGTAWRPVAGVDGSEAPVIVRLRRRVDEAQCGTHVALRRLQAVISQYAHGLRVLRVCLRTPTPANCAEQRGS